jgi:uncharacterized protein
MSMFETWAEMSADFGGVVRLFPLPNLVMFPHAVQPLRIFEPRYRAMLEDALNHDQLIAMALLTPGWEKQYFHAPPIEEVVCVSRVMTHNQETSGDYHLLLFGLRRARIVEELQDGRPYRSARVAILEDVYRNTEAPRRGERQRQLLECFQKLLPSDQSIRDKYKELWGGQITLGPLTDILAFTTALSVKVKQRLLAEPDVDARADLLIGALGQGPARRPFPPDFSDN